MTMGEGGSCCRMQFAVGEALTRQEAGKILRDFPRQLLKPLFMSLINSLHLSWCCQTVRFCSFKNNFTLTPVLLTNEDVLSQHLVSFHTVNTYINVLLKGMMEASLEQEVLYNQQPATWVLSHQVKLRLKHIGYLICFNTPTKPSHSFIFSNQGCVGSGAYSGNLVQDGTIPWMDCQYIAGHSLYLHTLSRLVFSLRSR